MAKKNKYFAQQSATASIMRTKGMLNSKHELMLYGKIGDWWDGMDALTIVRELEALDTDVITVRIHSQGGYITEGLAMYNALRNSAKPVHVYIDGICASMATVVAMAASEGHLYTPDNALWMIHKPWGSVDGNADQLREHADNLDVLQASMIAAYTATGRLTTERITEILATGKDYYLTGGEAVEQGIADNLLEPLKAAASVDLSALQAPADKHRALFDFYAASAAPTREKEETRMNKLKKLQSLYAALKSKGTAEADIHAALAKAMAMSVVKVQELLAIAGDETDTEEKVLQSGIDALASWRTDPAPAPAPQPVNDTQAEIAAERRRVADITALASQHALPDEQRNRLINDGATLDQARAAALEFLAAADRNRQPAPGNRVVFPDQTTFSDAMASALLHRIAPARFQLSEAAGEFRGLSLLDMAAECLQQVGVNTRGMSRRELAGMAMQTTSDFPNVVADVANKILLAAYQAQPRTFLPLATQVTLSNFKSKHAIEIGGGSSLKQVNEHGEYERGTVSEGKRSYKLSTFGRIFAFSRQLLIDDDIGAIQQFMSQIGALAARKESEVVWGLVKAGSIFSSGNKNIAAGDHITEAALSEHRKLMRQMKGLDGEPINIVGKYLVVNSDRETEAQKILAAILANASSAVNPFSNSLELIVEPLLDDVSLNPWYTFADPSLVPTLEYAYLEGESGPYIETRNGFEVDGIQIKVRHDFGAGFVSHRGAIKNPGKAA